ncbi:hypothetical protein [Synechococcus phage S-B68]|nr:hypothetical protein [Synechococcus phage S-B68]
MTMINFVKVTVNDEAQLAFGITADGHLYTTPLRLDRTFSYQLKFWTFSGALH